jgi:hypothetical protein
MKRRTQRRRKTHRVRKGLVFMGGEGPYQPEVSYEPEPLNAFIQQKSLNDRQKELQAIRNQAQARNQQIVNRQKANRYNELNKLRKTVKNSRIIKRYTQPINSGARRRFLNAQELHPIN